MGLMISWPLLTLGVALFCFCYMKLRERIPFIQRDSFEKIFMVLIMILLLANVGWAINERRIQTAELNDCIRFYRYNPDSTIDDEYYFIAKCKNVFSDEQIETLRESGREWLTRQATEKDLNGENLSLIFRRS